MIPSATETPSRKNPAMVEPAEEICPPPAPPPSSARRVFFVVACAIAIAGLGVGFWGLASRLVPDITAPNSAETEYVASFPEKSIAVLPFRDLDDAKPDLALAAGVQDDIRTALSKVADLRVISSTSQAAIRRASRATCATSRKVSVSLLFSKEMFAQKAARLSSRSR
jgi:hypothetical protein